MNGHFAISASGFRAGCGARGVPAGCLGCRASSLLPSVLAEQSKIENESPQARSPHPSARGGDRRAQC